MQKVNNNGVACSIQRAAWVRQLMLAFMLCVSVGFVTGCKEDEDGPSVENANLNPIDREFLEQAVQSNLTEIELGNLAIQRATNQDVKNYAQMMVTEHTAAHTDLKNRAMAQKWTIRDVLNDENQTKRTNLNNLTAADFDRAYMRSQVADHQVTAGKFATQIDQGTNAELKAYATQYKPGIDQHLIEAQAIVAGLGFQ
jgi:putative membrane protein